MYTDKELGLSLTSKFSQYVAQPFPYAVDCVSLDFLFIYPMSTDYVLGILLRSFFFFFFDIFFSISLCLFFCVFLSLSFPLLSPHPPPPKPGGEQHSHLQPNYGPVVLGPNPTKTCFPALLSAAPFLSHDSQKPQYLPPADRRPVHLGETGNLEFCLHWVSLPWKGLKKFVHSWNATVHLTINHILLGDGSSLVAFNNWFSPYIFHKFLSCSWKRESCLVFFINSPHVFNT